MRPFLFFLFLLLPFLSFAQMEKTLHQSFSLDSVDQVTFDLQEEIVVETWSGAGILTETKVELYYASRGLMKHFIEVQERYGIEADGSSGTIRLVNTVPVRKTVNYKGQQCEEFITTKIYVPEEFELINGSTLKRKN